MFSRSQSTQPPARRGDSPAQAPDLGLPLGVFKLCDRQKHVMERGASVCIGCTEEAEGVPPDREPTPFVPDPAPPPPPPLLPSAGPKAELERTRLQRRAEQGPPEERAPGAQAPFPMSPPPQVVSVEPPPRTVQPLRSAATKIMRGSEAELMSIQAQQLPWACIQLEVALTAEQCRIGSASDTDIHLDGEGIEALHALLIRGKTTAILRAMSAGGEPVLVNGKAVREIALGPGDLVQIGRWRMVFKPLGGAGHV